MSTRWHLTFHGVGTPPRALDPGEAHVWLPEDRFLDVLDAIRTRPDVSLTFDDGNLSDVETALPALRARGLRARFFVVAGWIGAPHFVDRDAIAALRDAGMTIGSHGMRHVDWRTADLDEELRAARAVLSAHADTAVVEAAIPFGAYSRRVLRRARALGYRRLYSSDDAPARDGAFLQPRVPLNITHDGAAVRARIDRRTRPLGRARSTATRLVKSWR